jgi:hypothetical protein
VTEYEVACLGKSRFYDRATARRRARQIRREGGPRLRPYACNFCGLHHLGHKPGHATYMRHGQPLQETSK